MTESAGRAQGARFAACLHAVGSALARIPRAWALVPALGWAYVIWSLSALPPTVTGSSDPWHGVLTNFAHALEYGVFAVWLALLVPRRAGWPDLAPRTRARLVALVLVYALSDELHQSFTPGRDASAFDVLTDVLGGALTLRVIASVAGPHAAPHKLAGLFAWGILACLASALLASYAPELFPALGWL